MKGLRLFSLLTSKQVNLLYHHGYQQKMQDTWIRDFFIHSNGSSQGISNFTSSLSPSSHRAKTRKAMKPENAADCVEKEESQSQGTRIFYNKQYACLPLPWRKTLPLLCGQQINLLFAPETDILSSQDVHYTNILKKKVQNKHSQFFCQQMCRNAKDLENCLSKTVFYMIRSDFL